MRRQGGWTIWSILSVALLVTFFALLFMKLFPPYFDNMKLQEALETVADDHRVTSLTRRQIITELDDILYIDYAHEIVDLKKSLVIEKSKTSMIMSIDYEVVVPLAYNISALLTFSNRVEMPLR
jgi:hypothetical protein